MRLLLGLAAALLWAVAAHANVDHPDSFVAIQQGANSTQVDVSCDTSSTALYNSVNIGVRSISCRNKGTSVVYICKGASSVTCSASVPNVYLNQDDAFTWDKAVRNQYWTCIAVGSASTVICEVERD